MATYDLNRVELNHLLTPEIDPSVRAAIIDFLFHGEGHDHDGDHGHHGKGHDHDDDHHHHHHEQTVAVQISDTQIHRIREPKSST